MESRSVGVTVTGASGFLGSEVMRTLRSYGVDVVGYVRGSKPGLTNVGSYDGIVTTDCLIHLDKNSKRGEVNYLGTEYINTTIQTCKSLLGKKFARVVYASSAIFYGDNATEPHLETNPAIVTDTYGKTKIACENLILRSPHNCLARLSNLYSLGMDSSTVFYDILQQSHKGNKIVPSNMRPICYFLWLADAAKGISKMALMLAPMGCINFGSGIGTSISQLSKLMAAAANQKNVCLISREQKSNKTSSIVLDVGKALSLLNRSPTVTIDQGA